MDLIRKSGKSVVLSFAMLNDTGYLSTTANTIFTNASPDCKRCENQVGSYPFVDTFLSLRPVLQYMLTGAHLRFDQWGADRFIVAGGLPLLL